MKTKTNQVIAMLVVASMVALTTSQINTLSAGDIVLKKDESGYHSYLVSYKKDGTGICLTYTDASCVETVSYDLTDGEWVYNSTDFTELKPKIKASDVDSENATNGQVLTADGSGGASWKNSADMKVYLHHINTNESFKAVIEITSTSNTQFTSSTLAQWLHDKGFTSITKYYPATATLRYVSSDDNIYFVIGIVSANGTSLKLVVSTLNKTTLALDSSETAISAPSLSDAVEEM